MKNPALVAFFIVPLAFAVSLASPVWAHHSYAMFDGTKALTVNGTVAKLEWANPHVFLWVYVPSSSAPEGYELYAFENGGVNVLSRRYGWTKTTVQAGEKIAVAYYPLKDGRKNGGSFFKVTHADGRVSQAEDALNTASVQAARTANPEAPASAAEQTKP